MLRLLIGLLLGLAGCQPDVCGSFSGQSCIALEVRGSLTVDQLLVSAGGAFTLVDTPSPSVPRAPTSLPVQLAVLPGAATGMVTITVKALRGMVEIGSGTVDGVVAAKRRLALTVTLAGNGVDLAELRDLAPPVDLAARDLADVVCDTTTQSPCPADQKCVFLTTDAVCRPAGAQAVATLCSGSVDPCARTEECLVPGGPGGGGVCEQFCGNDPDCKQAPVAVVGTSEPNNIGHCLFTISTQSNAPRICSVACNPVAASAAGASGCPSGSGCEYTANGTIAEFTFCGPVGSSGDGDDCSTISCQAGLSCLAVSTEFHCRPVCRKSTDSDCPSSEQCKPGAAGASSVMFGYCCPAAGC